MKVLWVGDACVDSGFALCTHAVCDELHRRGHNVNVVGINYQGDPHNYPYSVYVPRVPFTAQSDQLGVRRLPHLIEQLRPDACVLLNDPWNIPHYFAAVDKFNAEGANVHYPVFAGWVAVDARNQQCALDLSRLDMLAVWTQFAVDELRRSGYGNPVEVIPLGVDRSVFYPVSPMERSEAIRRYTGGKLTLNDYVIGLVGRNQPRKRIDLALEIFAELVKHEPQCKLLAYVAPTGDVGVNIEALISYYGLQRSVFVCAPSVGKGFAQWEMRRIYGMMDLYISTSQAEGFGLPALEAMSCGVPAILPNHSAFSSWAAEAALLVDAPVNITSAPYLNQYTIGALVDKAKFVDAIRSVINTPDLRNELVGRGLALSQTLTWKTAAESFADALEHHVYNV